MQITRKANRKIVEIILDDRIEVFTSGYAVSEVRHGIPRSHLIERADYGRVVKKLGQVTAQPAAALDLPLRGKEAAIVIDSLSKLAGRSPTEPPEAFHHADIGPIIPLAERMLNDADRVSE